MNTSERLLEALNKYDLKKIKYPATISVQYDRRNINSKHCYTITTEVGSNSLYFVMENKVLQIGNLVKGKNFTNPQRGRIYSLKGVSPCLNCGGGDLQPKILEEKRIRKLTPRECFRLMGLLENDIDIIQQAGISESQQYKLAGNSIVVDCLVEIFRKMFINTENEKKQMELF